MYRKFEATIEDWIKSDDERALLVTGARQVGKTWIIRDFARRCGREVFYYNFDENDSLISVFSHSKNPQVIISELEAIEGRRILPDEAIIIFDEIQRSEEAIASLKYFCESELHYRIIGAGSLLGVKIHRFGSNFPVGKVRIERMYPMDFEEFLIAMGEELLLDKIKKSVHNFKAFSDALHDKALKLYRDYLYIGGMPQAVMSYKDAGMNVVGFNREILLSIHRSYLADMMKYTKSGAETVKLEEIYRSVPRQLAKENHKFKYADIKAHAGKRDYYAPLLWLISSSMIYPSYKVDFCEVPLEVYKDENNFRIYASDVGILTVMSRVNTRVIFSNEENIFRGAITENYVAQQLVSCGAGLYYYKPSQNMEIDFMLDAPDGIIPVEVKSGQHKVSRSLKKYIAEKEPPYAYRFSTHNFGEKEGLRSVPLYAVCTAIAEMQMK